MAPITRINPEGLELEERVVQINRVSKVVKGGRRFSFSTVVIVGDGKGVVGIGMGKGGEVPDAIRKGVDAAKKNLIRVPLHRTTIPHEVIASSSASKVMIRPAAPGTGVIAGRSVRPLVEAAGIKDLLSKVYGSTNPVNVVKATFEALRELTSVDDVAKRRNMTGHQLRQKMSRRSLTESAQAASAAAAQETSV